LVTKPLGHHLLTHHLWLLELLLELWLLELPTQTT
jgi:hypothetical protein